MIAVLAVFRFRSMFPEGEELVAMGVRIAFALVFGFVIQRLLFLLVSRIEHWIRKLGQQSPHAKQRALTLGSMLRNLITALVVGGVVIRILDPRLERAAAAGGRRDPRGRARLRRPVAGARRDRRGVHHRRGPVRGR